MTIGTYQTDYREQLRGKGREIRIADGVVGYTYDFPAEDSIQDAITDFCETYDLNDGDPNVHLSIEVYQDGDLIDAAERDVVIRGAE